MNNYLFESSRIGFSLWEEEDIDRFDEINSNAEVMRYFPKTLSRQETNKFMEAMNEHHAEHGYCYFAARLIETSELIGFIGLKNQTYAADFNPSTDIGWRLHPNYWNLGLATEGALRCKEFAFNHLKLDKVISVASAINTPSINVMKKINMEFVKSFTHPLMETDSSLQPCVLYKIERDNY